MVVGTKAMNNKILIIDDNKEFRDVLGLFVEKQVRGVRIREAGTGEEGVAMALKERPRIALIDIQLPQMDGIEAASQIKRRLPGCDIITMSMFANESRQSVKQGVLAFIGKDELDSKLIPLLNKILETGGGV